MKRFGVPVGIEFLTSSRVPAPSTASLTILNPEPHTAISSRPLPASAEKLFILFQLFNQLDTWKRLPVVSDLGLVVFSSTHGRVGTSA
jgi:hypothetical protein